MAKGFVRAYRIKKSNGRFYASWSFTSNLRYAAHVESQGLVVWRDDGWANLADAVTATRQIAQAFSITDAKGQRHISWQQAVDEAEDL